MEKTLENIFIKQYEDLQRELELARKRISELEQEKESMPTNDNKPVVYKSFSKETCYLSVLSSWNFEEMTEFRNLTASEVKGIIDNEEKLRAYAKLDCNRYGQTEKIIQIDTYAFPYSTVFQGHVILIDVYKYSKDVNVRAFVLGDKDNLRKSVHYDIKEQKRLYDYGLTLFKEELENLYKKRLKKESENA